MIFKLTFAYENMLNNQPHTELILFNDIEILSYLVLDNNRIKFKTNKIKTTKIFKCMEINYKLLGIPWMTKEFRRKSEIFFFRIIVQLS